MYQSRYVSSKKNFRQKYINDMSIDSGFDGDYQSAIISCENMHMKNENRRARE
jgi:hypothetical protein